jgi:hypothetical protein
MKKVRINKGVFLRLEQEKLLPFVGDLVPRCEAQPELAVVQSQLDAVKAAAVEFQTRLTEAVHGGSDRTTLKNQALATLREKLDQLVALVEVQRLPEEVLVRSGFEVIGASRKLAGSELPEAEILSVKALGDGKVALAFRHPDVSQVRVHMSEWSADQGATWHEGPHGKRSPVKFVGLPPDQKVLLRMRSLGAVGRSSVWTKSVEVEVK